MTTRAPALREIPMTTVYPLKLQIEAVDKATASLREINQRISKFTAPVRKLNNSFKALSDEAGIPRLNKAFVGVGSAVKGVGSEAVGLGLKLAAIGGGAAFAFASIVKGSMEAGDQLGAAAERVGLTVDAYAQLRFAAAQADIEQEAFTSSMDKFNRNLGDMKAGGGEFIAFLDKVNPGFAQAMRGTKNTEQAFGLLTQAFEKVKDPAKRARLETAAFGKAGVGMGNWLGQGTAAMEAQRQKFLELAGSQEEFTRRMDDLDMASREAETALGGLRNTVVTGLAPGLTALAKAVAKFLGKNREGIAKWAEETGRKIKKWVDEGNFEKLMERIKGITESVRGFIEAIGGLKGVAIIAGVYLAGPLLMSVGTLAKAFWVLGSAALPIAAQGFTLLAPKIAAVWASFAPLALAAVPFAAAALGIAAAGFAIYKNWDNLVELFSTWSGWLSIVQAQVEMILNPLESLKTAGQWWGKELGITGGDARSNLGAEALRGAVGQGGKGGDAHVTVDFANVPRGVRVQADPKGTAPLDFSMGYSMIGG